MWRSYARWTSESKSEEADIAVNCKMQILTHDEDVYRRWGTRCGMRQICSCSCQDSLAYAVTQPSLPGGKPHIQEGPWRETLQHNMNQDEDVGNTHTITWCHVNCRKPRMAKSTTLHETGRLIWLKGRNRVRYKQEIFTCNSVYCRYQTRAVLTTIKASLVSDFAPVFRLHQDSIPHSLKIT